MPIISLIVPVYNVEKYLPRCVDSILSQSYKDFELILVDDGSPDNCGAICDEYALKDDRIKVVHQQNSKLSASRNAAINISKGEWITFVDSDDWIHKDYLKILLSGVLNDTDLVICGSTITSNETEADQDYTEASFKNVSLEEVYRDHYARSRVWGRIYKKDIIKDLRFISGTEPAEDSCFNELLFRNDMKFRITDAKLYYYFMRPDSAIHSHFGRGTFNSIGPLLEHLKSIDDVDKRKRIIQRCYKYVLSARYGELFTEDYSDVVKSCKKWFITLAPYLPELDRRDRVIMRLLCAFPTLYRCWRIYDDPTLLQFEKRKKQERRKNKSRD